jgi:MbtH protein
MPNPFDAETGKFLVLVNDAGQYSLWPAFRQPPAGWRPAAASGARQTCLDWVEANWTDIGPESLATKDSASEG